MQHLGLVKQDTAWLLVACEELSQEGAVCAADVNNASMSIPVIVCSHGDCPCMHAPCGITFMTLPFLHSTLFDDATCIVNYLSESINYESIM